MLPDRRPHLCAFIIPGIFLMIFTCIAGCTFGVDFGHPDHGLPLVQADIEEINGNTVTVTNVNGLEQDILESIEVTRDNDKIGELGLEKGSSKTISYEIPINNCQVDIGVWARYKNISEGRYPPGARMLIAQRYVADEDLCTFQETHRKQLLHISQEFNGTDLVITNYGGESLPECTDIILDMDTMEDIHLGLDPGSQVIIHNPPCPDVQYDNTGMIVGKFKDGMVQLMGYIGFACNATAKEHAVSYNQGPKPNCGYNYCHSPDICCKERCFPVCTAGTFQDSTCTCGEVSPQSPPPAKPLPPTALPTVPPPPLPPVNPVTNATLLVWYVFEGKFDVFGEARDESGNSLHATKRGFIGSDTGIVGSTALSLSGNGYLQAEENPLAGRNNLTISFWFKTRYPGSDFRIASAALSDEKNRSGWTMGTRIPEFWADDGEGVLLPGQENREKNFTPDVWNFEAVTYDGSNVREYTNGNLINTWISNGTAFGTGAPMQIGRGPGGYSFNGSIDDFRIYDRALNQDELNSLYALKNS